MQQYQVNQQSIRIFKSQINNNNSGHFNEVIRRLMLIGMLFDDSFCYQITSNLKGTPDNVFRTPFNVKSETLQL